MSNQPNTKAPRKSDDNRTVLRVLDWCRRFLYKRTILVLTIVFCVGVGSILWYIFRLQTTLIESTALQNAEQFSQALEEFRTLYTSEVVKTVRQHGLEVTHDYAEKKSAIPLPATLSMLLGKKIGEHGTGAETRLYSAYPFPWRKEKGGFQDEFGKEAWDQLLHNPNTPFYRFEEFRGRQSLRFAKADLMRPSCVNCHNTHPDTPRNDWKVGDVRGVLEIILPMDKVTAQMSVGQRDTFTLMTVMTFLGLSCLALVIGKLRRDTAEAERLAEEKSERNEALLREIGERKRAEEALQESEEKYRTILENIEDGYYEVDIAGNFTFFNGALCEILGYGKDELLGMNDRQYTDAENAKKLYQAFNKVYNTGKPSKGSDWEIIRKDGKRRFVEASVSLLTNAEGEAIGFRGIVRDITARKELEEQLRHAQKMQSIGTLAGGVAHEFNNLLTVILGNAEFGLQDLKPSEAAYQDFVEIRKASNKASDLTKQLLSFSRRQMLQKKPLDLNKTIEDLLRMLKRIFGEDIDLKVKLAPKLATVFADPGQVQQALMNVFMNARDAMPKGGRLTVESENVSTDRLENLAESNDESQNYVWITLIDTGTGMDSETLSHIFEPFYTTKEVGDGSGLGLSVVYGIIKQHAGHIEVQSDLKSGTTVKIFFPSAPGAEAIESGAEKISFAAGSGATILVVEDDESVRNVALRILNGLGYRVLTAQDGKEAMKIFKIEREKIDLVLMDVVMPEQSGPEVYQKMSALRADLPVIFATGYDADSKMKEFQDELQQASVDVLQKPYSKETLGQKVREVLDQD